MTADRLTAQREAGIAVAVAAYEDHPDLGFACCSAHPLADAAPALLAELAAVRKERDEARKQLVVVAEFVARRAEYITAIENCHPNNAHDYNRWQGHAESRRQLAQHLGLPVAWPANDAGVAR